MKLIEATLSLTQEEHHTLLEIFEQYLSSYVNIENNEMRIVPSIGSSREYVFIKNYIKLFHGEYNYQEFFQKAAEKRAGHIEWLFGSDSDDGNPEFNMPTNYEEMKIFLTNYDMDWLGDRN